MCFFSIFPAFPELFSWQFTPFTARCSATRRHLFGICLCEVARSGPGEVILRKTRFEFVETGFAPIEMGKTMGKTMGKRTIFLQTVKDGWNIPIMELNARWTYEQTTATWTMSDVGRFILNKLIPLEMMILDDYVWEALNLPTSDDGWNRMGCLLVWSEAISDDDVHVNVLIYIYIY